MKKIVLVVLTVLIVLAIVVVGYRFYTLESETTRSDAHGTLPSSGTATQQIMQLTGSDGSSIAVQSFNAYAREDEDNKGIYSLEEPTESSRYRIEYIAETQYFNVAILSEPLGENRRLAEERLLTILGISKENLCKLAYFVSVANGINQQYSGINLGFSFCPNAVKLP